MIIPTAYPPAGSGGLSGLGCGGDCGCQSCKRGMGDTSVLDSIWGALTTTLPLGSTGVPVWVLAGVALIAAASLLPKSRDYRRY